MFAPTPKIIWQTWKSKTNIPKRLAKFNKQWRDSHPDYKWVLLDDDDLRSIVASTVPQHLKAYDNFNHFIERVDFARYAILYRHGGIYADMDVQPLKRIDPYVEKNMIVLGSEPIEHCTLLYGRTSVPCNAFMISPPNEEFWYDLMNYIVDRYDHRKEDRPVWNTGPMALTKFIEEYASKKYPERFEVTKSCVFFPLTGVGTVTMGCDMNNDSYTAHVWQNSWVSNSSHGKDRRFWFWLVLIVVLLLLIWCFAGCRKSCREVR